MNNILFCPFVSGNYIISCSIKHDLITMPYLKGRGIALDKKIGIPSKSRYAHYGDFYFPTKEKKRRPCGKIVNWLAGFCNRESGQTPSRRLRPDGQVRSFILNAHAEIYASRIHSDCQSQNFDSWKAITSVASLP